MFDQNNQYTGKLFGQDRIGHTTPDLEASEVVRPWLPVAYPAPYLPGLRQDQGHPKLASVVLSSQMLVGQDKSGALVPAGLVCGTQANNAQHATGGGYYAFKYSASDVGFAWNPITGARVAAAGEVAVIAAPGDGAADDVITFIDGSTYQVTADDVTKAKACNLFPTGVVRPIGCTLRNVLQYIGGVVVLDATITGGMLYRLEGMVPTGFAVHNYMHEQGTAIQTQYVVRVPWIGATPKALTTLATGDGVVGYVQGYGRTFTHYVGAPKVGDLVAASRVFGDAGNFTSYDKDVHDLNDVVGRVIGVMNMVDKIGFSNRIKTLWDPSRMVGPVADPNPASIMMGGSATGGLDYTLNLHTDGLYKAYLTQKKATAGKGQLGTYILVRVNL